MRSRAIVAVIALSCAATAPIAVTESVASPVAQVACVHARIGGQSKCLARGKLCARRYERQYKSRGFTCKRGRDGRYRLAVAQQQQQQG
jgi:hypothetical protein